MWLRAEEYSRALGTPVRIPVPVSCCLAVKRRKEQPDHLIRFRSRDHIDKRYCWLFWWSGLKTHTL